MKWFRTGSRKARLPKVEAVHNLAEYAERFGCNGHLQEKTSQNPGASSATLTGPPPNQTNQPRRLFSLGPEESVAKVDPYSGPGYGKNLELLPGTVQVPCRSFKEQRLLTNNDPILEIIEHGSGDKNKGQAASRKIAIPKSKSSAKSNKKEDGRKIAIAKTTSPPPSLATDMEKQSGRRDIEVGEDSLKVFFRERSYTICVRRVKSPKPGFLADYEIIESLNQYKGANMVPGKIERKVSTPKPTSAPPGMN